MTSDPPNPGAPRLPQQPLSCSSSTTTRGTGSSRRTSSGARGSGRSRRRSGRAAIALARDCTPDIVLLDLRLPDMEGRDVARALLEGERTAHIPIVALTALRYSDGGARLLADGFSRLSREADRRAQRSPSRSAATASSPTSEDSTGRDSPTGVPAPLGTHRRARLASRAPFLHRRVPDPGQAHRDM